MALLGACATPLPVAEPDAVPAAVAPALSEDQVDRVLADVEATFAAADAVPSVDLLAPRVQGPAATIRSAQYALRAAGDAEAVTEVPADVQTVIAPATDTWPRTIMVVTAAPADLRAPLLLTLVQDSPRAQYRLWSWARLFPGVQVPATAKPTIGSPQVAVDSTALVATPTDVLAQYVDVLTSRDASPFAALFAADPLRTAIAAQRDGWAAAVTDKGTLAETYQALPDGLWSMGTADGGAIVVGSIQTVTTMTLADSTVTIGDTTAALLGKQTVSKNLAITWLSVVAFAVPPAGSTDPITVIGAEHSPIQVTGE
ncbi:MAG: hypothetical protein HGA44_19325 [Cellulomonadaceae bacterium]|nr:hypothetical protein [Cellulomonadaceae bacterium]